MALLDVIKHNNDNDGWFVWKHPSESLRWGSQLVVGEGQQAVLVKGGELCDTFFSGTYTLTSGNIPLLDKLINLPFGGDSPFSAEVWFVNTTVKRDLKWGTPSQIQLFDPALRLPVSARAFGKWGVRVTEPVSFLRQILGTQSLADDDRIYDYFIGHIRQSLIEVLSRDITTGARSVLNVSASLSSLSKEVGEIVASELGGYGIEFVNFNIESITIPDAEMLKIQEVYQKTFEARELSSVVTGGAYSQIKSFEVLGDAAQNPGDSTVGALLGAGIGLGAGLPLGGEMAKQMQINSEQPKGSVLDRLKELKGLLELGLISDDIYREKQAELLSEL